MNEKQTKDDEKYKKFMLHDVGCFLMKKQEEFKKKFKKHSKLLSDMRMLLIEDLSGKEKENK